MGMFDYVTYSCPCPYSGCPGTVSDFQSKDGPCVMATVEPDEVRRFYSTCPECSKWVEFEVVPTAIEIRQVVPPLPRPVDPEGGFTLLELMVVVILSGMLAVILLSRRDRDAACGGGRSSSAACSAYRRAHDDPGRETIVVDGIKYRRE